MGRCVFLSLEFFGVLRRYSPSWVLFEYYKVYILQIGSVSAVISTFISCCLISQDVAKTLGDNLGVSVQVLVGGRTKKKMLYPELSQQHLMIATVGALSKLTTVRKCALQSTSST